MGALKNTFLQTVCAQIGWKSAHPAVMAELGAHIEDRETALKQQGLSAEQAEETAVAEMGDAESVGLSLNTLNKPQINWQLLTVFFILVLLGRLVAHGFILYPLHAPGWIGRFSLPSILPEWLLGCALFLGFYFLSLGKALRGCCAALVVMLVLIWGVLLIPKGQLFINIPYLVWGDAKLKTHYMLLLYPILYAGTIQRLRGRGGFIGALLLLILPVVQFVGIQIAWTNSYYSLNCPISVCVLLCAVVLCTCIIQGRFQVQKPTALACSMLCCAVCIGTAFLCSRFLRGTISPEASRAAKMLAHGIREIWKGSKAIGQGEFPPSLNSLGAIYGSFAWNRGPFSTDYRVAMSVYSFGWLPIVLLLSVTVALLVQMFLLCKRQPASTMRLMGYAALLNIAGQFLCYILCNIGLPIPVAFPLPLFSAGQLAYYVYMSMFGLLFSILRVGHIYVESPVHQTVAGKELLLR